MITNEIVASGKFANEIANARFREAPKLKMNKKEYTEYMKSAHLAGKTSICESIINSHKETPYKTVDELIGDLQLLVVESANEFRQVNIKSTYNKVSVENFM